MKQAFTFLFLFSSFSSILAQDKEWTWVSGDKLPSKPGIYGPKGVPGTGYTPGGRSGAIQWTDASGNLWLMGGFGLAASGTGNLNDLWKYSPATAEWTWVSGDNTANAAGTYGIKGTSDPSYKPGARNISTSFSDASGNLWLMGGYNNSGSLNDLWKFTPSSPTTGEWTWVSGDNTGNKKGIYGTKLGADLSNKPGARYSSASCTDANGDLWLFGGYGFATKGVDFLLNDLWKFSPSTGMWTWVSGDSATGKVGIYGTKGEPDDANKPGARYSPSMWTDANGNIWLFGGTGYALTTPTVGGELNDLWMFNPSTNQWTWVSGDDALNVPGSYGTINTPASTNKPGGRHSAATWKDANGMIYLFGGFGYPSSAVLSSLNDLWKLDPLTAQWTWQGGPTTGGQKGIYGTQGSSDPLNTPGSRYSASSWIEASGKLWIFGGSGTGSTTATGYLNDLWSYKLSHITLPVLFGNFTAQKQADNVQLKWNTVQEQNSHHFIIERSTDGSVFENIGKVAASGNSSSPINYSFIDFAPLKGINHYRLKQFDIDGHFLYSKVITVVMEIPGVEFTLLQNPVQGNLQVRLQLAAAQKLKLAVKDASGNTLLTKEHSFPKGNSQYTLPVDHLSKGVYYLTISADRTDNTKTFIKL